jgi:peptidyl-prolyl cis-trans isomerase SurA
LIAGAPGVRGEIIERVVARVNGDIVTLTELEANLQAELARRGEAPTPEEQARLVAEVRKLVLDGMIDNLLVLQKARERGLRVPPRYFEEWKANAMKESKIDSEEEFQRQLTIQGMKVETLKKQFEESVMINEVRRMEVENKVSVNEPEIEKHYRENIVDYTDPATIRLREVVVRFAEGGEAEASRKATRALQDIRQGADFGEVARLYSESASKESGGDLGTFEQGELDAPLESAAWALSPGEVSDLIRRESAFYILKVEEKTEEKSRLLEEVRSEIAEAIFRKKVASESDKYMRKLREEAIIEILPTS